jgi:hypothetical protein
MIQNAAIEERRDLLESELERYLDLLLTSGMTIGIQPDLKWTQTQLRSVTISIIVLLMLYS